jgi:Tol biopolymer transport system component
MPATFKAILRTFFCGVILMGLTLSPGFMGDSLIPARARATGTDFGNEFTDPYWNFRLSYPSDWTLQSSPNRDFGWRLYSPDLVMDPLGRPLSGGYFGVNISQANGSTLPDEELFGAIVVSENQVVVSGISAWETHGTSAYGNSFRSIYFETQGFAYLIKIVAEQASAQAIFLNADGILASFEILGVPVPYPEITPADLQMLAFTFPAIKFPFSPGSGRITSGYNNGFSHTGGDLYALDMVECNGSVNNSCYQGQPGQRVIAPTDMTLIWSGNYNGVSDDPNDFHIFEITSDATLRLCMSLAHFYFISSGRIPRGTSIGTLALYTYSAPHIHMGMWTTPKANCCACSGRIPIPYTGSYSLDGVEYAIGQNHAYKSLFSTNATTGVTTRVSVSSSGEEGNAGSGSMYSVSISADGRYVAFASTASNLVADDTNAAADIFVRDRQTGITTRVSVSSSGEQTNGSSSNPSISADGYHVAFVSDASNLVTGDTNGYSDVFVHDRQTGSTTRVSVSSAGVQSDSGSGGYPPSLSADGRYVAFNSSATNLVPGDHNNSTDIFVYDSHTSTTERVSVDHNGSEGNMDSNSPSISADGRWVVFSSAADNLDAGDDAGFQDVFVHDRQTGGTERVSLSSSGEQGNNMSLVPSISADGRYLTFLSYASNLVPGDNNGHPDIFIRDRLLGTTRLVSVSSDGVQGNAASGHGGGTDYPAPLSADGRYIAYLSSASNLVSGDANNKDDVFVYDRLASMTTRISLDSFGIQANNDSTSPSISGDGRIIAFSSSASNLVMGDVNGVSDVFAHDRGVSLYPSISGNAGVAGAILSYTADTLKIVSADVSGDYSFAVPANWSGTVTPSLPGYLFSPASLEYLLVRSDQTGKDYLAAIPPFSIFLPLVIRN